MKKQLATAYTSMQVYIKNHVGFCIFLDCTVYVCISGMNKAFTMVHLEKQNWYSVEKTLVIGSDLD